MEKMQTIKVKGNIFTYNYGNACNNYICQNTKNIKKLWIYINFKHSDGTKYLNKKHKHNAIFIDSGYLALKPAREFHICKISLNSVNHNLDKRNLSKEVTEKEFNEISEKYIKYNPSYNYKKDGYIVIYLNNVKGWWKKNIDLTKINNLISKIRQYKKNNKIIIRLHKKNYDSDIETKIRKLIKDNNTFIDKQNYKWEDIINNCYCIFIQQAKTIYELFAYGVPLFNLNIIMNINYFPEMYIPIENLDSIESYEINRKKILRKHYFNLVFSSPKNWFTVGAKAVKILKESKMK